MRKILGVLVLLCATGFVACGDKDSAAVGTWVLDAPASFEASRAKAPSGMEEMFRMQFEAMKVSITVKRDKTFSSNSEMGGDRTEETSGTWSVSGDQVTMVAKLKDGKPAVGESAKPLVLTLKGDTMSGNPSANVPVTIVLKRR